MLNTGCCCKVIDGWLCGKVLLCLFLQSSTTFIPAESKSHPFSLLISVAEYSLTDDSCAVIISVIFIFFLKCKKKNMKNKVVFPSDDTLVAQNNTTSFIPTWSSLLVCRRRCLRKSSREHFLTRMRSVVPSARWAEGDRPLGLRGHAQLILAALMAMNFPRIWLQTLLPSETESPQSHYSSQSFHSSVICKIYCIFTM